MIKTFSITKETLDQLKKIKESNGAALSASIRLAVDHYFRLIMKEDKTDDGWMGRTTKLAALEHFFDFMYNKNDLTKCVGLKVKETGEIIYDVDGRIEEILSDPFAHISYACFYNFVKDIKHFLNKD